MDDRFVVVGFTNGSVSCLYVLNYVTKWVISVSYEPITAVLADLYDEANEQRFYIGDSTGSIFVINEKGKVIAVISTKAPKIFGILAMRTRTILTYYDGGAYEYELNNSNATLLNEYTSTGRYSVDADGTFHNDRTKVGISVYLNAKLVC